MDIRTLFCSHYYCFVVIISGGVMAKRLVKPLLTKSIKRYIFTQHTCSRGCHKECFFLSQIISCTSFHCTCKSLFWVSTNNYSAYHVLWHLKEETFSNEQSVCKVTINYVNLPSTHHYLADKPQFLADVVVSSDRVIESPLRPFSQSVMSRNIFSSQVNLSKFISFWK